MTALTETTLKDALRKYFGFSNFKGEQERIVQNVLDGRNTFVIMPTGGGEIVMLSITRFDI